MRSLTGVDPYQELTSRVDSCLTLSESTFQRLMPANKKVRKEAAFLYQHVKKELDRRKEICHQLINRLRSMEERSETITDDAIEEKIELLKGIKRAAQDSITKLKLEKDKRKSAVIRLEQSLQTSTEIDESIADAVVKSFSVLSRKL